MSRLLTQMMLCLFFLIQASEAEQGKESAEEKAKTSPAPKEKQQAKKQETTPKKEAGKSR